MKSGRIMGREQMMGNQDLARARRVAKACVETLEGRQLLAGYGELFSVEPQDYSSAGGAGWLPNGGYVAAWTTGIASYYQGSLRIYSSSGAEQATRTIAPPQALAGPIGVAADGHFVAAYSSISGASVTGIWVRVFGADGTPSGDPISVASDGYGGVVAVAPDGRFAVAYTRSVPGYYAYGTFVRRFDPSGVPVGPEISVGTYTTLGSPYTPAIGMEPSGKMTFAWYGYGVGIRVRQMNWDGTFVGEEFGAVSGDTGDIWNPRLGVDASGRFAVSWTNPNQGIGLRMFGADQQPLGPEVYMPDSLTGSYDLAVAADGRGVVIWAKGDARGQRFDLSSGSLVGDVLPVLPPGAAVPNYPVLAVSNSGQILCVWRTTDSAFGGPVQGVTYGPGLPPTGIELSNASVAEAGAGLLVGTFATADPDPGDTFAYILDEGGDNSYFQIVGNELRTAAPVDADLGGSYTIGVTSQDSSGWQIHRTFTITPTQVNEAPTAISLSPHTVGENQPAGTAVGTLQALDPDPGDAVRIFFVAGQGATDNGLFQIVNNEVRTTSAFDYETRSSYSIRVKAVDRGGKAIEQVLSVQVTDQNESPSGIALSRNTVEADRPAGRVVGTLSASDPDAGSVLTYSLVGGEGAADNGLFEIVGTELRTTAMFSYPHGPLSIRVRVTDAGGLSAEGVLALTVIERNDPPTAAFSGGVVTMGSGAQVRFRDVQDAPGDLAAGFLYSYDFDADGTYDVVNSTSASVEVPASYLGTFGAHTVRGRVTDQRGASSEYEAKVNVSPPMEWWPLYGGLSSASQDYDDETLQQVTTEYRADAGGGLLELETEQAGAVIGHTTTHLIKIGTTWYTTAAESPAENGLPARSLGLSAPIPLWDEGVATGKVLRWSGITMTAPTDDEVVVTGPMVTSGSVRRVKIGSVTLSDGKRFDKALLAKITMTVTYTALYQGQTIHVTETNIVREWYVRGIGPVRSDTTDKTALRSGSRQVSGTESSWEQISGIPQWARYVTLVDGTLYVGGSEIGDRISLSVEGTDLLVYRNGAPARVPLASVQKVVIAGGEGNDIVDLRGLAVAIPVEVEGGAGNDRIYGGMAGDTLDGGDGDDRMYGYAGDDVLLGGGGNDRVYGGNENDSLTGGAGVDLLQGQNGDDWIDGRDGLLGERISGGAGVDSAYVDVGERAGMVETREEGEMMMVSAGTVDALREGQVAAALGTALVPDVVRTADLGSVLLQDGAGGEG